MKVWGKEFRRLDEKDFELYLVDDITEQDNFVQILEKNVFGLVQKLNKIIYTDGDIAIVSQRDVVDRKLTEIEYKLVSSTWFLKHEKDSIQLYVKANYEGKIKTSNKEINHFLDKHYARCREVIISKKRFAKEMSILAARLNLPFELVLAFRGDEKAIDNFINTVKKAIENCFYADSKTMKKLINKSYSVRQNAFEYMGLYVPKTYLGKSFKIGQYVYNCLEQRKIISNKDN